MTCLSAGDCWAVGFQGTTGSRALIEHYMGRWAIVATPNPGTCELLGVTCVSAVDCWAVGNIHNNITGGEWLKEHYMGGSWAVDNTHDPVVLVVGELGATLNGVTCVRAADCGAVGVGIVGANQRVLIEHRTRTSWSVMSAPNHRHLNG